MTNKPWMPLYVQDYLTDTVDLTADETGTYLLMLMLAWRRQDGAIPNDMEWLKRALSACVSDMHGNRFKRIVPKLLDRYFTLGSDGKFRNKRLTKEREKTEKLSGNAKENAEKRWSKDRKNKELADATAMLITVTDTVTVTKKEDLPAEDGDELSSAQIIQLPAQTYAFEGEIVRLNQGQFDRWEKLHPKIDLTAELALADAYYFENPPKDGKWFFPVSRWLEKANREQAFKPKRKGVYGDDYW